MNNCLECLTKFHPKLFMKNNGVKYMYLNSMKTIFFAAFLIIIDNHRLFIAFHQITFSLNANRNR